MKHIILTLAIAIITAAVASDEIVTDSHTISGTKWEIVDKTDEMTDEVAYLLSVAARESEKSEMRKLFGDETRIVICIEPKGMTKSGGMKYKPTVSLYNSGESFDVDETKIITRYNREKAKARIWKTISPAYKIAVAPDSSAELSKLVASTNLAIRFQTILGETKTQTFDISGLTNALKNVKARYPAATKSKGAD